MQMTYGKFRWNFVVMTRAEISPSSRLDLYKYISLTPDNHSSAYFRCRCGSIKYLFYLASKLTAIYVQVNVMTISFYAQRLCS